LPASVKAQLDSGEAGFTVVVGDKPEKVKGNSKPQSAGGQTHFPSAGATLIERKPVFAVFNGEPTLTRLTVPKLDGKEGFETLL
jgi:hypothetical protein